jgi:hypothetical protein
VQICYRKVSVLLLGATLIASAARGQNYLIDTGPGGPDSVGATSLFGADDPTCSPQPECATHFQFLAAQFILDEAVAVDSVEGWTHSGGGGSIAVVIRSNSSSFGFDSPGVALFSKTYTLGDRNGAGWEVFGDYGAVLPAGTYWLTFEPVAGSGLNRSMPGGASNPLPNYAFSNVDPNEWVNTAVFDNNPGWGIRIAGTASTAPASFGSASRAIFDGSFGDFFDAIHGDAGVVESRVIRASSLDGTQWGRASIVEHGLSVGAWSSSRHGTARGVAFRTFVNSTSEPLTFRVNALVRGHLASAPFGLPTGSLGMGAAVRVFDEAAFLDTIGDAGVSAGEFLLSGYDILAAQIPEFQFDVLISRFPGSALLANAETFVHETPQDELILLPIASGFITVAPQETFTVMFDISTYSRGHTYGSAYFLNSLTPAADFFTDADGNPVVGITPLGPSPAPQPALTTLTLAPGTATGNLDGSHAVTVTARHATNAPVANVAVKFIVISGPNAGVTGAAVTGATGQGTFTYSGTAGVGTDEIQAEIGDTKSNIVQMTWDAPGPLDHIIVTPLTASLAAGDALAFTAEAFDRFNFSRGDVTAETTFSIGPNGSCAGAVCTATVAGLHTITANHHGKIATASLTVTPGALDRITISPAAATIPSGGAQVYSAAGFDRFNNGLGDVTGATAFSITPNGSCMDASCTASIEGPHTVTATYQGKTATASLAVSAPNTCGIALSPVTLRQPYLAVPYVQILTAKPSGRYTFSVSSGALPPGLRLVASGEGSSIVGAPTLPGSYSFSVTARQTSSCSATRTYVLTIPETVVPLLQCVAKNPNRSYTARFGYDNSTGALVTIAVGASNFFAPGNQNRGQTTVFQPGLVQNAFSVTFSPNGGDLAVWFVRGPDGVLRPLNVTTASLKCP